MQRAMPIVHLTLGFWTSPRYCIDPVGATLGLASTCHRFEARVQHQISGISTEHNSQTKWVMNPREIVVKFTKSHLNEEDTQFPGTSFLRISKVAGQNKPHGMSKYAMTPVTNHSLLTG
jgi:hypothetical protein